MTTTDQIKSLMKSGDVAGAEALCRSQSTGRDVSTKRPRTDAPWARPYQGVASRKSRVAGLWVLALGLFLTPLAVRADMVLVKWQPPMISEIWPDGLRLFVFLGLPLLFGGGLFTWVYRRIRLSVHRPKGVVFRWWLVWCLMLFVASLIVSALAPRPRFSGCGGYRYHSPDESGEIISPQKSGGKFTGQSTQGDE